MDFWGNTSLTLTNCTITGNSAAENTGGMICDFGCSGSVINSIVWGNTAPIAPDISPIFGSMLDITYSDVYVYPSSGVYPGAGNINNDPLFVTGPLGDYYLSDPATLDPLQTVLSPCVNAGNPATTVFGTTRTDGVADTGIVDMGRHYPIP